MQWLIAIPCEIPWQDCPVKMALESLATGTMGGGEGRGGQYSTVAFISHQATQTHMSPTECAIAFQNFSHKVPLTEWLKTTEISG